jgi:hypothetical protein
MTTIRLLILFTASLQTVIGVEVSELYGKWEVDVAKTKVDLIKIGLNAETLGPATTRENATNIFRRSLVNRSWHSP